MAEVAVVLPQWGQEMEDARMLEWLVEPGARVALDDPICLVETDKVNAEVVAPASGVLGEPLVGADEVVAVGTTLTTIETDA
jgi:2-oxoglutarate dehydrogenase E2 component (dihydrolipoamide succinyltransferase)